METIAPRSPVSVGSRRLIAVAARRMASKVPIRLIAMTFLYASRLCADANSPSLPTVRCAQPMPAELTSTRSGPSSLAWLTAVSISAVSVTSTETNSPPTSLASSPPLSALRSATTTFAPLAANWRTTAAPMPDAPPVTIALAPLISTSTAYDVLCRG
ncbi:Uncharacterised protein [Mycobacteroides abscessus subsp. abscessus]|nr:Uncharacterised protein [Mycobacteroides abscessus subsp. abscessus]